MERQGNYNKMRKDSMDTVLQEEQLKFWAERTAGLSRHSVMTAANALSRKAISSSFGNKIFSLDMAINSPQPS